MKASFKGLFVFHIFATILLFLYSFTQIDLNLTLSQIAIWQTIQRSFQQIGFFQRPLSTALFITILIFLFTSYLWILYLSYKEKISRKTFWTLFLITSAVLVFSYNAFSYDLFNYIFDAKILTHYHLNPYFHKALDFPGDPMLLFMRWTHRLYPYGPLWLGITIPLSFLGMGFFLPTLFIFKIAVGGLFVGSVYFLEKILEEAKNPNKLFALSLFAFNPLVLIESLVSSHNDIVMVFFAIFGIYLFLRRKIVLSVVLIIISYLVKSVTIFLLVPIAVSVLGQFAKYKITKDYFFRLCLVFMLLGLAYVLTRFEIQPWYFLWILPFVSVIKPNKFVVSQVICVSLGLLLTYAVFISQGNYVNIVQYKIIILLVSAAAGILAPFILIPLFKTKLEL